MKIPKVCIIALLMLPMFGSAQPSYVPGTTAYSAARLGVLGDMWQLPTSLQPNLVAWYRGDGNGIDSSGSGNDLTFINGFTTTPIGVFNSAFFSDGVNDTANVPVFNTQVQDLTLCFWMYTDTSTTLSDYVVYNGGAGSNGYGLFVSSGTCSAGRKFAVILGGLDCNVITATTPLVTGSSWHFVSIVNNGGAWSLYLDGANYAGKTRTGNVPSGNFILSSSAFSWPGKIDEVMFFDRALTSAENDLLFNRNKP